ncbi:hypothetical protein, variant [Fonticula alba]|uniref:RING-type domain-containing protein n=1 Tax=Fonticula alba TaxID=691883 RepID=A0A058ZB32_FONAL|nr:hypothetical protein, variant [Fonticula alba]KCV71141.1 hypothetical protein, variant [Fonticula alba]|eukprot:XP_009494263.1 hypothetical protein, variant [Fonticula alba]
MQTPPDNPNDINNLPAHMRVGVGPASSRQAPAPVIDLTFPNVGAARPGPGAASSPPAADVGLSMAPAAEAASSKPPTAEEADRPTAFLLDCSICLTFIRRPMATPCGHVYCRPCLLALLKAASPRHSQASPTSRALCPICREPISYRNCIRLFLDQAPPNARTTVLASHVRSRTDHSEDDSATVAAAAAAAAVAVARPRPRPRPRGTHIPGPNEAVDISSPDEVVSIRQTPPGPGVEIELSLIDDEEEGTRSGAVVDAAAAAAVEARGTLVPSRAVRPPASPMYPLAAENSMSELETGHPVASGTGQGTEEAREAQEQHRRQPPQQEDSPSIAEWAVDSSTPEFHPVPRMDDAISPDEGAAGAGWEDPSDIELSFEDSPADEHNPQAASDRAEFVAGTMLGDVSDRDSRSPSDEDFNYSAEEDDDMGDPPGEHVALPTAHFDASYTSPRKRQRFTVDN